MFVEVGAPTDDGLHALLQTIITRPIKLRTRRGVLMAETERTRKLAGASAALPDAWP
ncbi:hypothetical protein [uncultured Piscinibacter sp.]|uniref:hypothetical protein n=1 Tax=uncultured Piscinibacter sp. TaxID=1131835 RepID=UPI00261B82CE|nr:hypothetical protein [uncultured Piscinibacter sp.]